MLNLRCKKFHIATIYFLSILFIGNKLLQGNIHHMHKKLWALLPLTFLLMSNAPVLNATKAFDGRFYDSSLKMNFTDTSKENIDKYYSAVDNTSTGSSFINELYSVISTDNHFVKYADVNKWYQITDRNWELSQPIDPDTFKFSTTNNYYFTLLYFKDNETKTGR